MKRYSLIIQLLDPSITTDHVRNAVEEVLLHLHPLITYKIGQVTTGADGRMVAEIAVDGKRELLQAALTGKEWRLPIKLESIGWGWMINNEDAAILAAASSTITADPLAGVDPLEGTGEFRLSKRRLWLRYISLITFTIVMIFLLIANALHTDLPLLEAIYVVGFALWLFFLNETPFDIRVYAEKIVCGQVGLEVTYWWRKKPIQVEWEKIWGLDYADPVCEVCCSEGKRRFLLSERFGCKEKSMVLQTIVKRSSLNFVEGNFKKVMYRRYGA